MSTNPEPYAGDEPLYCHIGAHTYEFNRCKHCGHKEPMIDSSLPNKNAGQPQQRLTRQ